MSNSSAETDTPSNIPPYTPMTSLGHELGVLFGFLSACFVVMAVYVYFWRAAEHREEHAQALRREMLLNRGIHHGRGGIHEKMMNQATTATTTTTITSSSSTAAAHNQQQPLPGSEIGVAVTTGIGSAMEIGSPSLGPARMINLHRNRNKDQIQGNSRYGGGGGGGGDADEGVEMDADVGVEMDVLGFLQHGHGNGHGHGLVQQGYAHAQGQGQGQGQGYGR
ncbi:hypothetical protein BO78DRAFT_418447 [Aspergillus sclerotiicarbonarius CBS 121057]|uniref:Uncharacterized protein n=1 Tax=Aspergillus sclerotiicarbonarius (strain CBS 121057 / IBT 28362) TaxID=1448318 RepID=A0A319EXB9_ASPSB|nr:hypothetical protein BO78DRAFT_418447 [Aspergillus sclerotiicarbonarius CBS 121057]